MMPKGTAYHEAFHYVFRTFLANILRLEYWNADTNQWVAWGTDIPGNNKKFFITVNYVDSSTNPTIEFPKNVTIVSSEGDVAVENYSNMESKFSETGFEWAELRYDSDNSLAQTLNSGQWINVSDTTTCKVTIELTNIELIPENDDFEYAQIIDFDGSESPYVVTGSNVNSSIQVDEPVGTDWASPSGEKSVWYSWTSPNYDGDIEIDLLDSSFDTQLAVYTGNELTSLTEVASNEDYNPNFTSRVRYTYIPNTEYKIVVNGYDSESGDINMILTMHALIVP
jgi:hypothetical protein